MSCFADSIDFNAKTYLKSVFTDTKDVLLFPKRWDANQWITAGTIATATGILIYADDDIQEWTQKNKTSELNDISKYLAEPWGSNKIYKNYSLITAAGLFSYGLLAHDSKATHCAFSGVKAFFITGALTIIPKTIFGRQRPNVDDGPDYLDWRGPLQGESFFSGHTSVSFAFASVVAEYYKDTKWVPILAYTFASMTGLSRIYDNKHWASDVLAGAAFGISIGKLVAKNDNKLFVHYNPDFNSAQITFSTKF